MIPCRTTACTSTGETILNCPMVGSNSLRSPEPSFEDTFVYTQLRYMLLRSSASDVSHHKVARFEKVSGPKWVNEVTKLGNNTV